jgi:hypothetical protein
MRKAGKKVGSCTYVHREYAREAIPADVLGKAQKCLSKDDRDYTCIKHDRKTGNITFQWCHDFNTAHEPTVGKCVIVKPDGSVKTLPEKVNPQIWHHKWMWVKDDYPGFDIEASKCRSKQWEPHVTKEEKRKIGTLSFWNSIKHRWEE